MALLGLIVVVCASSNSQQCSAGRSLRDGSCKEGEPIDVHEVPCTGPLDAKDLFANIDFEKDYWRRRPVLIRRHCASTFHKLELHDLSRMFPDAIAGGEENNQVQLSSFRAGDEYVRIIAFYANIFLGYLDGASVVYNQVDTMWPHAAKFIKGQPRHLHAVHMLAQRAYTSAACPNLADLTAAFPTLFSPENPPSMNLYVTPPGGHIALNTVLAAVLPGSPHISL